MATIDKQRQALCDWLTANGIDIHRVPRDSPLIVNADETELRYHEYLLDQHGKISGAGPTVRVEKVAAITVPPPPTVRDQPW